MRSLLSVLACACGTALFASCGGGSSSGPPPPPPPTPSFLIAANPTSVAIAPSTSVQTNLTLTQQNGFSGTVSVSVTGLPAGVTTSPASPFTLPVAGLVLTFDASSTAQNGTYVITCQGASGTLTSNATVSVEVEPLASFSLSIFPSELIVTAGNPVSGTFNLTTGSGATNYSVNLSIAGLPSGVTASFEENPLPAVNTQQSFTLNATSAAASIQNATAQLVATRTLDGATASANFTFTVAPPPGSLPGNRTTFAPTYDVPSSIVYDSVHNLIFSALPHLFQVDVIDPTNGQVVNAIAVPGASGLSMTPDGTQILATGYGQEVAWIDTTTQQIVQQTTLPMSPSECAGCPPGFVTPGPAFVLASGNVLFLGAVSPNSLMEWNPANNQVSYLTLSESVYGDTFGVRSADGSKVLITSDTEPSTVSLFDSAANNVIASVSYPDFAFALAANPTGTQFAVAVNGEAISILDDELNTVGQAPVGGAVTGMVYSPDGRYLYLVSTPYNVPLISTIDTATFQLVGQAPAFASNILGTTRVPPLFVETPMAADATGMLFGAADHGVALDDSTLFQSISAAANPPIASLVDPGEGPTTGSTPVTIPGIAFAAAPDVWFGSNRGTNLALNSTGQAQATSPPSTTPGPVNVKIISPDGTEGNIPEGFGYGAMPYPSPVLASSPSGGSFADIYGFGFGSDIPAPVQVLVNGISASVDKSRLFPFEDPFGYQFPIDDVGFTVPPGSQGAAAVTVNSSAGEATISGGLHYAQSVQDYPSTDTFQFVLFDPSREQLYLSAGNRIDVFSLTSNTFLSPIVPPTLSGKSQFVWLALTPDDSQLLAANLSDDSVAIINPDTPQTAQVVQILPTENGFAGPDCIATTQDGIAFISTGNPNPDSPASLSLYQLNLSTLQVTPESASPNAEMLAARNGSTILAFAGGSSGGPVYSWTSASGSWSYENGLGTFLYDGAVSGDGNAFAVESMGGTAFNNAILNFFDPNPNLLAETGLPDFLYAYRAGPGMKLNDSGSLAYLPVLLTAGTTTENAIDIYDVEHHQLRERFLLSGEEELPTSGANAVDIDPTGQNIFVVTETGLTVVTLDSVPLSIGSVTPNSGSAGTSITIRGSGFVQATTVTMNGASATASFVDADTLQTTIPPSLAAGAVSITLTNPEGTSYVLSDSFTIN